MIIGVINFPKIYKPHQNFCARRVHEGHSLLKTHKS